MMKKQTLRWILFFAGIILTGLSFFMLTRSNINLGVILPGILGIPLILYGIFYTRCSEFFQRRSGRIVKWIFICGYLSLAVIFIAMGTMIATGASTEPPAGADAVIVLGAGLRNGTEPSYSLKNRLDAALGYASQNPKAVIVVSGGQGHQEERTEASAMKEYLMENELPSSRIIVEARSTSTYENFVFSKEILDERFDGKNYSIVFATNDFHIFRASIIAKEAGFDDAHGLAASTPAYIAPASWSRECLALLSTFVFGASID